MTCANEITGHFVLDYFIGPLNCALCENCEFDKLFLIAQTHLTVAVHCSV